MTTPTDGELATQVGEGGSSSHPAEHAHAVMHCNLNTVDLARGEAFYTTLFGVESRMRSVATESDASAMGLGTSTASITTFFYDRRGPRAAPALELVGWERPRTAPGEPAAAGPGFAAVGFRVPSLAAVAERLAELGGSGTRPDAGISVRGDARPALCTTDPDGVPVEIVEIPPATADPDAGLLSHERLRVSDLPRALAWYAAIGFTERAGGSSDSGGAPAASLVLPEDPTFSLELEQCAAPAEPVARTANTQGLYRIALAVDDVRAAHAALVARPGMSGVPEPVFIPMPDVPTGGFTVLFLRDPDGAVVELVERPRSAVCRPLEPR